MTESPFQNLQRMQSQHARNQRKRATEAAALEHRIGASLGFAAVAIMLLAGIADILSIFQIPVAWVVGIIGLLIAYRINRIRETKKEIANAIAVHAREYGILCQRLGPLVRSAGRSDLITPVTSGSYQFSSYLRQYVAWSVATQLFELIPIVNFLPTIMARYYREIVNQRRELKEAKAMLVPYRDLIVRINALERFELEYTARLIATSIRAYQQQGRLWRTSAT
jgi:hypothetical protein